MRAFSCDFFRLLLLLLFAKAVLIVTLYLTQELLVELCFQLKLFYVHGPDASRRDVDEVARTFAVRFAAAHGRSMPAHKSLMLSFNPLRLCFPFQVVADKPFLAK